MADKINEPTAAAISNLCDRIRRAEQMIADNKSGQGNLLNDQGRICERMHADENRIESLERGAKIEAQTSLELRGMIGEVVKRVEALEKSSRGDFIGWLRSARIHHLNAATDSPPWLPGHEPPPPTCGTCRWWFVDDPLMPYKITNGHRGNCIAHPNTVQKMAGETCGEHSPR
jgi:hypothetical protein